MTILGKYELFEPLGRGGFGTVYRAEDRSLERLVAVKVLHAALAANIDFLERFRQEARVSARFRHPNLVGVYEVGEVEGRFFIAMEYMPGGSLQERLLRQGRLSYSEAVDILQQISAGLQTVHAQRLVHRDVKPGNILFGADGQAVLSDFGLAKAASLSSGSASSHGTVGTPYYKPPELWLGKPPACPATDVYSLACVFYEMLSGKLLFPGDTPDQVITRHLVLDPEFDPAWLPADAPEGLEAVIKRALERDPAARFKDAEEFAQAAREVERAAAKPGFAPPVKPDQPPAIASSTPAAAMKPPPPEKTRSIRWGLPAMLEPGGILANRYHIIRLLEESESTAVYLAWGMQMNQPCMIYENSARSAEQQSSFEQKASQLCNLRHPNLAQALNHISIPGQGSYLVMDQTDGENLEVYLEQAGGVLPLDRGLKWMTEISEALVYLQMQIPAIVHGDILPKNIVINKDGSAVLTGYIPWITHRRPELNESCPYWPPERYGEGELSHKSDLYGLGATAYHLLTGLAPASVYNMRQGVSSPLIPAEKINPQIPHKLSEWLAAALQQDPARRPASAYEFLKAVAPQRAGRGEPKRMNTRLLRWFGVILLSAIMIAVVAFLNGVLPIRQLFAASIPASITPTVQQEATATRPGVAATNTPEVQPPETTILFTELEDGWMQADLPEQGVSLKLPPGWQRQDLESISLAEFLNQMSVVLPDLRGVITLNYFDRLDEFMIRLMATNYQQSAAGSIAPLVLILEGEPDSESPLEAYLDEIESQLSQGSGLLSFVSRDLINKSAMQIERIVLDFQPQSAAESASRTRFRLYFYPASRMDVVLMYANPVISDPYFAPLIEESALSFERIDPQAEARTEEVSPAVEETARSTRAPQPSSLEKISAQNVTQLQKVLFESVQKRTTIEIEWGDDGKSLFVGSSVGVLWFNLNWSETGAGLVSNALFETSSEVASLDYSESNQVLAAGLRNGDILIWKVPNPNPLLIKNNELVGRGGGVNALSLSPDGQRLAAGSNRHRYFQLWDTSQGKRDFWLELPDETSALSYAPDGGMIAAGLMNGDIIMVDSEQKIRRKSFSTQQNWKLRDLVFSPDGALLASSCPECGTVEIWDLTLNDRKATLRLLAEDNEVCVAFSPDGEILATGWSDQYLKFFHTQDFHLAIEFNISTLAGSTNGTQDQRMVLDCAFSNDGELFAALVASASSYDWIGLWGVVR